MGLEKLCNELKSTGKFLSLYTAGTRKEIEKAGEALVRYENAVAGMLLAEPAAGLMSCIYFSGEKNAPVYFAVVGSYLFLDGMWRFVTGSSNYREHVHPGIIGSVRGVLS